MTQTMGQIVDPGVPDTSQHWPGTHLLGPALGLQTRAVKVLVQPRCAAHRTENISVLGCEKGRSPDSAVAIICRLRAICSFVT
jgi:hypothetical protein